MPSVPITRGRLTALWLLLRSADKLGGRTEVSELMAYAQRSSLRAGGLPISDGLRLARGGGFLFERAGTVDITELGSQALLRGFEDEPVAEVIRLFISVLLLRDPPPWVAYWQGDPSSVEAIVPPSELRLMKDCGLFPTPTSEDIAGWGLWQALSRVPLPEDTARQRKVTGDAGEELTMQYEQRRLESEGFPDLAGQIQWVAQESAAYGFDVLSFNGRSGPGSDPRRQLAIEVKSTLLPAASTFRFYLTAHEWETALGLGEHYIFHLWSSVDPGPPAKSSNASPHVVPAASIASHLPVNPPCDGWCEWENASLTLPLNEDLGH
jgi:hypothetical protein